MLLTFCGVLRIAPLLVNIAYWTAVLAFLKHCHVYCPLKNNKKENSAKRSMHKGMKKEKDFHKRWKLLRLVHRPFFAVPFFLTRNQLSQATTLAKTFPPRKKRGWDLATDFAQTLGERVGLVFLLLKKFGHVGRAEVIPVQNVSGIKLAVPRFTRSSCFN